MANSPNEAKRKANESRLVNCPESAMLTYRVFDSHDCKLTGFKGDFDATANCFDVDTVKIESVCKTVSIIVYRNLAEQRFDEQYTPEFYYS
jgi:hypothetical protein